MNYFERVMNRINNYNGTIHTDKFAGVVTYKLGALEVTSYLDYNYNVNYNIYYKNTVVPLSKEDINKIGEIILERYNKQEQDRINIILEEI